MSTKGGKHHYGNRKRRTGRNPRDNPHIRHSKGEDHFIDPSEDYEVRRAAQTGAIEVYKDGGIRPVKGRTHIEKGKNGTRLAYDN